MPVNPGGIPIYRGGKVVGGVGVAGVRPEFAEYAATARGGRRRARPRFLRAARQARRGLHRRPAAALLRHVHEHHVHSQHAPQGVRRARRRDSSSDGTFSIQPRDGLQAPENYVLGPRGEHGRAAASRADEVRRIIDQAVAVAFRTRAMIRLPINQPTRMTIGISDESGAILALYRMPDGTVFSSDVAMTKARNAYYFSTREGYDVLASIAANAIARHATRGRRSRPRARAGRSRRARSASPASRSSRRGSTCRKSSTKRDAERQRGPWFDLYVYDTKNACTEGPGPSRGGNRSYLNQSGIVWFPGSVPLYRGDSVIGGLGVSGDGVEQDDYVSLLGSEGFHPPDSLRVDNSVMTDAKGRAVRLPYLKLPRNPEIQK